MTRANDAMLSAFGITADHCGCTKCVGAVLAARPFPANMMWPFIVCGTCGNKRCPKANDHSNDCTGSNAPGQPGSSYPAFVPDGRTREERIASFFATTDAEEADEQ